MKCYYCETKIELRVALERAEYAWPLRQTIWSVCEVCGKGNYLRFEKGKVEILALRGSPGFDYDLISSVHESGIEVRQDPEYLHVWLQGQHYEIKARH